MKRRHLAGYVLLAVVAALLLTVGVAMPLTVAVGVQNTCEGANASRDAGLYEDALEAYAELLKNDTYRDCAMAGIQKLQADQATKHYELGKAYEEAQQYDLAREEYKKALEINSSYKDAQTTLTNLSNPFAAVRALTKMGLYTEARGSLKKVVEENPGIDVPEDLKYLRGEEIFFWILPWGIRPLVELLVVVIGVLVVWLIRRRIASRKPRLDIEDFDKGATDLDIGKGLAAMVEVSFKQIGEFGAHGSRPSLIAGPIEKIEIPADVKSVHPYIKTVSAFIEWLLRTDVYTLSGYLQKSGGDLGAGLTLSLVRKKTGEIMANETIWQKDFDPAITQSEANGPAPYYRLAEPAAIWTIFHDELPFKKKLTLLGTRDWRSFAYFRAGVRWAREEQEDKARKLYIEALNQDTNNRGARFNLGALDTEAGKKYARAIDRLEMARGKYLFSWSKIPRKVSWGDIPGDDSRRLRRFLVDDLDIGWAENAEIIRSNGKTISIRENGYSAEIKLDEKGGKATLNMGEDITPDLKVEKEKGELNIYAHFLKEPVWYKATYQLAATYHYQGMVKQDEAEKLRKQAEDEKNNLSRSWQKTVKAYWKEGEAKNSRKLAEDEAEKLSDTISRAINTQQKSEDKALTDFLESFKPMAVIIYAAILVDNNKEEKAKKQIESVHSSELSYRGHYNMACYYSILGKKNAENGQIEAYDHALRHLKYALERGGEIVQWAQKDESLKGVREDRKVDFYALIHNNP